MKVSFMAVTLSAPVEEPDDAPLERPVGPTRRILVVDDEPLIRQLYIEILVDTGYEVDVAENGAVAWHMIQKNHYDLLITDNEMPEVSGVELLKRLHVEHITLPVIMATATFPEKEFKDCPWIQPEVTLLKPYTSTEFFETVEEALNTDRIAPMAPSPSPAWQIRRSANHLQFR